ncbi:MAG: cation-translocating P-type ATPase [Bacteroidales bacterium]
MKDFLPHAENIEEVAQKLDADLEHGLTEEKAAERLKEYGYNELKEKKEKSIGQLVIDQFKSAIIYLLLAAATVSFVFGEIPEAIAIVVVIILNTAIGFFMEFQAQSSMKTLRKMDRINTSVLRGGKRKEIEAEKLVPGDVVFVVEGNLIPADCRVFEQNELKLNESALTGESLPVNKQTDPLDSDTPLADRSNMVFKGTSVSMGNGKCIVATTGMNTSIGDISEMVSGEDNEQVPLNIKLNRLSKQLIWIVLGLAASYGLLGYLSGQDLLIMIQTAIAWAIAAIPEGLAIVATIALARGMLRLADANVIVKKLAAVETLGETTTILTDKTGTLTKNKLSVEHLSTEEFDQKAKAIIDKNPGKEDIFTKLIEVSALCNNTRFDEDGDPAGDTVEVALLEFIEQLEEDTYNKINQQYERIDEDPFDSESKFMATMHQKESGYFFSLKGASDTVMKRCKYIITPSGTKDLSEKTIKKWKDKDDELSGKGLKTLAFAYKQSDKKQSLEEGYIFIGLIGFLDPPKEGIKDAVETFREAGIRVVMITGDHPETSKNVARQVSIVDQEDPDAFTGQEIKKLLESKNTDRLARSSIFARVDPRQKLDILNIFKEKGDIVGMTGDGVNDAPALKMADIGIAMGKRGSQVAKEYADMILKTDHLPSMVTAIRQGRIIFENIRKFVIYQLSYHLSEILIIATVSFSVLNLPLLPLQLLFLNLLADVFPALALALSKGLPHVMQQPPKDPREPILTRQSWHTISSYGVIMAVWITGAYFVGLYYLGVSEDIANNIAFFSLAFTQLAHVFNMRERKEHFLKNQVTQNKYVWYAIGFCTVVILSAYFIPFLSTILSFQAMGTKPWILVIATMILSTLTIQILKSLSVIR